MNQQDPKNTEEPFQLEQKTGSKKREKKKRNLCFHYCNMQEADSTMQNVCLVCLRVCACMCVFVVETSGC